MRKRLNSKVTRSLAFMTLVHACNFFTNSFSSIFTNKLPYRGIVIAPYLSTLFLTTGITQLACNLVFVTRYRNRFVGLFRKTQISKMS